MNSASTAEIEQRCACPSWQPYTCWYFRYGDRDEDSPGLGDVRAGGGPCECSCHDDFYSADELGADDVGQA